MSLHHPDEATLLDYVAGSLPIPKALAVSVHLCFCNQCRRQISKMNAIGGALLETATPASLEQGSFDALMAHIDAAPAVAEQIQTEKKSASNNPLLEYLPAPLDRLDWQQQTKEIGKFDLSRLIKVPGFQVALQRIAAGARVPTHTHGGTELTVILSGGFSDELGVYHAGDFIARDPSHKHSPTALQNEDCICLTVLDAPIKFTGWQRLFNPFMHWH